MLMALALVALVTIAMPSTSTAATTPSRAVVAPASVPSSQVVSVGGPRITKLHTFVRGTDGHLYHQSFGPPSGWGPSRTTFEDLGGGIAGNPQVVMTGSRSNPVLHIFVRGADGHLYHKWSQDGWGPSQTEFEDHGGDFVGDPAVVSTGTPDGLGLHVVMRGRDGHLYHHSFENDTWNPSMTTYEDHGGDFKGNPAVVSTGTPGGDVNLHIFARGRDRRLYHQFFAGEWGPSMTTYEDHGGDFAGDPAVVSTGPPDNTVLQVFARGRDRRLYHQFFAGTWVPSLTTYEDHGGDFKGSPVVVSTGTPDDLNMHIFLRGRDNRLYHQFFADGYFPSLTTYEDHGGRLAGNPAVASTGAPGALGLRLFVAGQDGRLLHQWFTSRGWGPRVTSYEAHGDNIAALTR